jgi:putative tryptophan/tyrosine transport system substrate-binding protein
MRRRDLLCSLSGAAALGLPLVALAQAPDRNYRLGALLPFAEDSPPQQALLAGLRAAGFVPGQNLIADPRGYKVPADKLVEVAAEVVKAKPDVILAGGDAAIRVVQQATTTVPILAITEDMVGSGLVASMARPGANTTGISLMATELDGKRQEILIELVPGVRRIAALADTVSPSPSQLQALEEVARARGIQLSIHRVANPAEVVDAIAAASNEHAEALNVLASALLFGARRQIIEAAAKASLPAIYQWPDIAAEGGLSGYGPRFLQLFGQLVPAQLVKLLRGAAPADLPVLQPTHFELAINLKTANALGLTVPPAQLARADEVIE